MMKIRKNSSVFDRLVIGEKRFLFNLFYLIKTDKKALIFTDEESYIIAKSNKVPSVWLFVNDRLSEEAEEKIVETIGELLVSTPSLKINGEEKYLSDILIKVSKRTGIPHYIHMCLNVYACFKCSSSVGHGKMISPSKKYTEDIAQLIQEMVYDAEGIDIGENAAFNWAKSNSHSDKLYLWKDDGIVSMAMVAHKNSEFARINTVVTAREKRDKGYAAMLVSSLTKRLLDEGVVPMLYADKDNPSSNALYRKVGYVKQGEITEYKFDLL